MRIDEARQSQCRELRCEARHRADAASAAPRFRAASSAEAPSLSWSSVPVWFAHAQADA